MSSAIAPSAKETRRSRRRPAAGQRDMLDLTRNGGAPQRESSRGPDESDDMLWDPTTGPFLISPTNMDTCHLHDHETLVDTL